MEILKTDVLITGAGPSGLLLACYLSLHHIDYIIIDKVLEKPENSGALVIHAASLEILASLGLLDNILSEATIVNTVRIIVDSVKEHSFDFSNFTGNTYPYPAIILLEQFKLERILKEFLISRGQVVTSGNSLNTIEVTPDFITSEITRTDLTYTFIRSRFIVGADGKNSTVRELSNIPFRKYRHKNPIFITDYQGESPVKSGNVCFSFSRKGSFGIFPLNGGYTRLDGSLPGLLGSGNKITSEDFKKQLPASVKIDKINWFSVFYGNYLLCDSFSFGNIFLIGDAAHTHNPVGGQGMNSGFQDALNLGWKLAYVITGRMHHSFLETYTSERRPVVEKIMQNSSFLFRHITNFDSFRLNVRMWLTPLILKLGAYLFNSNYIKAKFFTGISQLWINYKSPLILNSSSTFKYKAGSLYRIYDMPSSVMNHTNFKLLIFSKIPQNTNHPELSPFPLVVINIVKSAENEELYSRLKISESAYLLLRPDNYIALMSKKLQLNSIVKYFKDLANEQTII
jgi:2-polyprenyl-6-methoxyphenol hydroxylase-like FAD-dependent oxidoreductase